jgi:hypothetical protein
MMIFFSIPFSRIRIIIFLQIKKQESFSDSPFLTNVPFSPQNLPPLWPGLPKSCDDNSIATYPQNISIYHIGMQHEQQ